ncbi:MAG: aldo/keto reductase [Clostridia bacterium]|nr:aldo/keto reductase [Clostridia bacterium]
MKKLGFGLMRLPKTDPERSESIDLEKVIDMTDRFLEQGYTYFDTAYMYHNYESEKAVKKILTSRIDREKFLLATKLPTPHLEVPEDMERIFSEQQEKCGAEYFDYYLLHALSASSYELATRLGAFDFILQKKAEGKVRHFGFSFHDTAEVLDKILTEHPEVEFVQLQINYLDWESPTVQSRLCYEVARKHGKDIIIMEPIKGGALANVPAEAKALLSAANPDKTPAQWALQFVATLPGVVMVLSGMSDLQQLEENTRFFDEMPMLTEDERAMLFRCADIINKSVAISCTACEYCITDCPKQIPIPQWFDAYNKGDNGSALAKDHATPADCIGCGLCEKQCPQKLPIRRLLSAAKQAMKL